MNSTTRVFLSCVLLGIFILLCYEILGPFVALFFRVCFRWVDLWFLQREINLQRAPPIRVFIRHMQQSDAKDVVCILTALELQTLLALQKVRHNNYKLHCVKRCFALPPGSHMDFVLKRTEETTDDNLLLLVPISIGDNATQTRETEWKVTFASSQQHVTLAPSQLLCLNIHECNSCSVQCCSEGSSNMSVLLAVFMSPSK